MGMAARIGDMTAHGGSIVVGNPTVLIGGMPASCLGDMHVCPMVTPGVPPIPHVGGPITLGSTGVLIGKKPAARQGDMAVCTGPPDSIIIGCPTVMIGEISAGGGGGGGGGAGAGGTGSATKGAITSATLASITPGTVDIDDHFLDVSFHDKAKLPITGYSYTMKGPDGKIRAGYLGGRIKRTSVPNGNYEISLFGIVNAQWSKQKANVGDKIKIKVDVIGIESGTEALLQIFQKDFYRPDELLHSTKTKVKNDTIEADWEFTYKENRDDPDLGGKSSQKYSQPQFYFTVSVGDLTERSGFLQINDELEIELKDENGDPIANEKYKVYLPNGEVREGTLDSNGKAVEKKVPVQKCRVDFPNIIQTTKMPE